MDLIKANQRDGNILVFKKNIIIKLPVKKIGKVGIIYLIIILSEHFVIVLDSKLFSQRNLKKSILTLLIIMTNKL